MRPRLSQTFPAQRSPFGPELSRIGAYLLKYRQYPAAEKYIREYLTIREKRLPGHWLVFSAKSALGEALLGQKKFERAEALLLDGHQGLVAQQAQMSPQEKRRIVQAVERLVELYTTWGKLEEAAKWRQKLKNASDQPMQ